MTPVDPHPAHPAHPDDRPPPVTGSGSGGEGHDLPLTHLRGAGVDVDPRRALQMVLVACLVASAVVALILLLVGVQKNAQSDNLQHHGVPVEVTVTGCMGLLGGSGSNGAGFACKGSYQFHGRQFEKYIPGDSDYQSGTVIPGVIVADDPGLLSTPSIVADQHASWKVFIAPAVLVVVSVLILAMLVRSRRRTHRTPGPAQ